MLWPTCCLVLASKRPTQAEATARWPPECGAAAARCLLPGHSPGRHRANGVGSEVGVVMKPQAGLEVCMHYHSRYHRLRQGASFCCPVCLMPACLCNSSSSEIWPAAACQAATGLLPKIVSKRPSGVPCLIHAEQVGCHDSRLAADVRLLLLMCSLVTARPAGHHRDGGD